MKINLLIPFCLISLINLAQQVSNIHSIQEGKQVIITFDITGGSNGDKFDVKLYYSQDKNDWKEATLGLAGDIGKDITVGTNKTISWSPLKEITKLTGSGYSFKVKATVKASDPYGIAANMVLVAGGTFSMGCTNEQRSECENDSIPSHIVTLKSFSINKYEVTQGQWKGVMENQPTAYSGCDKCPVENASWNDIQEFLIRLNSQTAQHYRLPTEAEWEYAARGGSKSQGYKYSGSNNFNDVAWSDYRNHMVGQKQSNELQIYDMSGNVWEWCADWYDANYYTSSPSTNPKGSGSGKYRVVRGGSYYSSAFLCRVANRGWYSPDLRNIGYGFRLAQDL